MSAAWAPGTRETYGSELLVYHVYCDSRSVPERDHCPATTLTMVTFISTCAGAYAGPTLNNYVWGVKAWHTLHGLPWVIDQKLLTAPLTGATRLAPPSSARTKRESFTVPLLLLIRSALDFSSPFDAAFFACLTTTFWSMSRLGEFTVPSLTAFSSASHVTRGHIHEKVNREGLLVTVFSLPRTKSSPRGKDVYWAKQDGPVDPLAAIQHHFGINNPSLADALFAWQHPSGLRPLMRTAVVKCSDEIATQLKCTCMVCA